MPEMLCDYYTSVLHAWNFCPMQTVNFSASASQASSVGSHSSVVASTKNSLEDVVRVPTDDNVTEKEVAVRRSDPQSYRCEEVFSKSFRSKKSKIHSTPLQTIMRMTWWTLYERGSTGAVLGY